MRFLRFFGWALVAALAARAAEPLNPPVPFSPPSSASAGQTALTSLAAKQAQEMGLSTIAVALYRQLLAVPGADRQSLTLDLATALLDDGHPDEASVVLFGLSSGHNSRWHLLEALAQADLKKYDQAEHELAALRANDLAPEDRSWYLFLEGRLAEAKGDSAPAQSLFGQASESAPTELARARFFLARENAGLQVGQVTEQGARQIQQNAIHFQGTATGYEFERTYAVMLNALHRKSEAVAALQSDILALPAPERAQADDFRLLLGLVAGAADGEGRSALVQLLESGSDADRQRVALQLIANASTTGATRAEFRAERDKLLAGAHPILAELFLFRAQWALEDGDYATAADDAQAILSRFPGSPLKGYALAILTGVAWDQNRFRTAAENARQAQATFGAGEQGAQMRVLVAEALFRAGAQPGGQDDYRAAAEAYAAAVAAPPDTVPVGRLMFQRIEAEILAGSLERAGAMIDEFARNAAFDTGDRWEAEWNLVRALQLHGDVAAANARINRLLGPAQSQPADPSLRARMVWLQAQVSFDADQFARTLEQTDDLVPSSKAAPQTLGRLEPSLRTEISGAAQLLRAQAYFALGRESEAQAALEQLRAYAPESQAAVKSYLIQAQHYAQQGKIVEARQTLRKLADDFPKSADAPYALLQSAYLAERLGQEKDLRDALGLIKELITKHPDSDLIFDAYLKAGEVQRELNDFPQAEDAYKYLVDHYSLNPDIDLAKLALADCHNAQVNIDSEHEEQARSLYEELLDKAGAAVDVRVEAGYKLGTILIKRGPHEEAEKRWFRDVIQAFLFDPEKAAALGPRGMHWMTLTLLDLGNLYRNDGKLDQAGTVWRLILDKKLPGAALAQARLDELAAGGPKA